MSTVSPYACKNASPLPYTRYTFLAISTQYALTEDRYVPKTRPRKDWLQYGRDPRSAVSFKHNLGAILDLAARRGDRVLLMTFATYVAKTIQSKGQPDGENQVRAEDRQPQRILS